ncbi:hypothetical protein K493DRAFT_296001 [Basidiobolus meristosporus CBS 931.73]|uniref:G protein-coupled receptor n=1 Tax=Basidiobolus meristosporus CBS 931.73 TaxID=1314790 RepID=A0A1Y1Z878_9FUNG|nr:hypothetical protein K493DRAFT_296000 [Basidiobolus meristosporus CBS 931.73]ORY06471.1 hypothetical protein K493DRAFT_296001 [Basidiobolus meristosporus CBS 931.73]|eukprot:ORY06470.1 hypothetical protein K493DRAFT_296000 [Basidiobolus meristosporus CBS 931.73]
MLNWTIFTVFNILSILCSVVMVTTMLGFWLYQRKLVERISFRLVGLCAICDVMRHAFRLVQIYANDGSLDQNIHDRANLFQISSVIGEMALLTFILYTFEIVLNLQLVLVHQVRVMINHQAIYFAAPPIFVLAIAILSECIGGIFFGDVRIYLLTLTIFVLFTLILCYTLVICIMIVVKLVRTTRAVVQFHPFGIPGPEKNETDAVLGGKKVGIVSSSEFLARKAVRQAIIHILMYPVAMFIVGFPTMVVRILYLCAPTLGIEISLDLEEYSNALQGVVNFVCFLLDPALHTAVKSVKRDLLAFYYDEKSQSGPSASISESTSSLTFTSTFTRRLALWCTERFILGPQCVSKEVEVEVEEVHTLILVNSKYEEINSNLMEYEHVTNKVKHL